LKVTVPSWRVDVTLEDDLVEEVARSIGYDRIPEVPLETRGSYAVRSAREWVVARARQAMRARGLTEAWCTTLVSEREALETVKLLGDPAGALVRLRNPMSREGEVLRPNLLPGLLRACAHNLRQGCTAVRLFEVGSGFLWRGAAPAPGTPGGEALPEERLMLAAIVTGPRYAHAHSDVEVSSRDSSLGGLDFSDAKGLWEAWLEEMNVDSPVWGSYSADGWKPGASAEVAGATSRIGWAGTLSQQVLRGWEIDASVHVFVALLDSLTAPTARRSAAVPGRFPPIRRDVAFFVPESVTHRELEQALAAAGGEWLRSIELFDVYAGPGTPQGMKSMAYALQFQHPERTMTESEIQATQDRMAAAVASRHGGRLRER
jgi:phenylalanyl-tRNA synthetase beta chain